MTLVPKKHWWLILAACAVSGLALGLADPWLGRLTARLGVTPGLASAVGVNLLLPLAAVALRRFRGSGRHILVVRFEVPFANVDSLIEDHYQRTNHDGHRQKGPRPAKFARLDQIGCAVFPANSKIYIFDSCKRGKQVSTGVAVTR